MTVEVTIEGDTLDCCRAGVCPMRSIGMLSIGSILESGSDISVYNLDVEFHVLRFAGKLWVLPEKTAGASTAIDGVWRKDIAPSDRCWDAFLDEIPRAWRKSLLWGLVRPHAPGLLVLPVHRRRALAADQ